LSLGKLVSIEILTKKPSASIGGGSSRDEPNTLVVYSRITYA